MSFHMSPEEFLRQSQAVMQWIADYHDHRVTELPVLSQVESGEIRASLPPDPPQHGEDFATMLADFDQKILPGITHWQSPNFYAYFPTGVSGPSLLGEFLSAGLAIQGMLWTTSPACTDLEAHMMDWVVKLLDLPEHYLSPLSRPGSSGGGVIQDSASSASLCAILAARERATAGRFNEEGGDGRLVAYTSNQAHSSIEKDVKVAGIGRKNLRLIPVDEHAENFAMDPIALRDQMVADRAAGKVPFFVSATVGTTSSGAVDPLPEIGAICEEFGASGVKPWLHVDGAMMGTAAVCPEFRGIHRGLKLADSYLFNPHKWMLVNFDCTCMFVKDRAALVSALSVTPEYLRNSASDAGEVIDYRDWQVPLGRRFRALKLWFVLRHYGVEGLQFYIRRHVEAAAQFAGWVEADPHFELVTPRSLNLVCFRLKPRDIASDASEAGKLEDEPAVNARNEALMKELNASGQIYLSHTKLAGKYTLRLCVGQAQTEIEHVRKAWELIQTVGRGL